MNEFGALADDRRREIFEVLAVRERSVNELVEHFGSSQPAISQHLRTLREAGLVLVRPDGQRRIYRVNPQGLQPIELWLERYRRSVANRLDNLEQYLDESETDDE